jgi:DNA-binding CsgD family transcriptional regulator
MLAYHWHAAHDTRRALAASVSAGRQAAATFAPSEAQRHFERALELWPGCPDAAELTGLDVIELGRMAAEAAQHGGAVDRALSLLDEALLVLGDGGDPVRRAGLLEQRATTLRDLGRGYEAVADARAAVALLPEDPPSAARARVLAGLANLHIHADDMPSAVSDAKRAVAAALAAGETRSLADARVTLGAGTAYLGQLEEGLAILREGAAGEKADAYTEVRAYANLADTLGLMGRHEEAVEAATAGMALAERVGLARTAGSFVAVNRLESLLSLGRWEEADAVLAPELRAGLAGMFEAGLYEVRARMRALQGRYAEAAADLVHVRRLIGDRPDNIQFSQPMAFAQAEVERAGGDLATARRRIAEALESDPEGWNSRYGWPLIWLGMRVEAESAEPDDERVAALARLAEAFPVPTGELAAYRALTAAERARRDGAAEPWQAAVDAARAGSAPYLLAYALLRLAEALAAGGDRATAATAVSEAIAMADDLGAEPVGQQARALARRARLIEEPDETGENGFGLTGRELEVLRLVADGRSNGQIAEELFISRKTASVHVSNILAKLGVTSRVEAAALAHRQGLA